MTDSNPSIVRAVVRLVPATRVDAPAERPRRYRPLVVGAAVLHRPVGGAGPWAVDLADDQRMLPRAPRCPRALRRLLADLRSGGRQCRVATALVCPADVPGPGGPLVAANAADARLWSEIYGWSLMYQPPGFHGRAFVDRHEEFPELPACFELPLELLDRIAFLESRGIRTRPIALVTRPEDFTPVAGRLRNRFRPDASFRPPCHLERLLGLQR